MKDISFFSNTKYIILPSKKKPRVFLALGKNKMVEDLKIILDKIEPIKND